MKRLLILFILLISNCATNIYPVNTIVNTPDNFLAYRSVALLYIRSLKTNTISAATGFAYDENRIITAGHFCISALEKQISESHMHSIEMRYYDHEMNIKEKHNLEIESISKIQDVCVLKKKDHELIPLKVIEDYDTVKIGDNITIVGVPDAHVVGEFSGKVMSVSYNGFGPIKIKGSLIVSAAAMGGISGSPIILDETGEVIGVVVMSREGFDHLTFGITGHKLNEFIDGFK